MSYIYDEPGVLPGSIRFYSTMPHELHSLYYEVPYCGYYTCDHNYCCQREKFVDSLLCYIIKGSLSVGSERVETAKAGDIVLMDCTKPHKYFCDNHVEFLFLHYCGLNSGAFTESLLTMNESCIFHVPAAERIKEHCLHLVSRLQPVSYAEFSMAVHSILCLMTFGGNDKAITDNYVSKAIQFIDSHVREKLTLDDIADAVHLSKYYFSRLFKYETGISPMSYVSVSKLNAAKTMLKTTKMSTMEIANELKYASPASFINSFKEHVGLSPSQFRKFLI